MSKGDLRVITFGFVLIVGDGGGGVDGHGGDGSGGDGRGPVQGADGGFRHGERLERRLGDEDCENVGD